MADQKPQKYKLPEMPDVDIDTLTPDQLALYHSEKVLYEECLLLVPKLDEDPDYVPLASEMPAFDRLMGTDKIASAKVVRDPTLGKNPLNIICHPPGKRLYWANPRLRDEMGWNNLHPVKFDDFIGREIEKYVPNVPEKLAGSQKRDGLVRRGDAVLSWIDFGIWQSRQDDRTRMANQHIQEAADQENRAIRRGGQTFGEGLQDQERPARGFAPSTVSGREAAEREGRAPRDGHLRKRLLPGAGERY